MARQISMEDALAACEVKLGQLTFQNVLLKTQLDAAEAELEERQAGPPSPPSEPPGMQPHPADPEIRETEARAPVSGGASRSERSGR